jgi:predicted ATP-grasp superfamily ATP-dependent carboligase
MRPFYNKCGGEMKVLITDGNFKHTLAAVRSMGKQGYDITVLSHISVSVSFFSKYCNKYIIAPNPQTDPTFADFVLNLVKNEHYDVILPISYDAVMQLSPIRDKLLLYTKLPIADARNLEIAGNKDKTMQFAEKIGIAIPKTWYPSNVQDIEKILHEITYPAVIKGSEGSGYIRYANSQDEIIKMYNEISKHSPIIQEYIPGDGYGFFALYNHGNIRAMFMHKRLREYPSTGGPSAAAESIYDTSLKNAGMKILNALHWHGVAMVEFKKDSRTNQYVLMEINPKFWGSLDLSIVSGIDFPTLTCIMANDGEVRTATDYLTGIKFRWLFPADLFHAITTPRSLPQFLADFIYVKSDFDIDDIKPTFMQMGMTVAELILRIYQRRFWVPHGRPYS